MIQWQSGRKSLKQTRRNTYLERIHEREEPTTFFAEKAEEENRYNKEKRSGETLRGGEEGNVGKYRCVYIIY